MTIDLAQSPEGSRNTAGFAEYTRRIGYQLRGATRLFLPQVLVIAVSPAAFGGEVVRPPHAIPGRYHVILENASAVDVPTVAAGLAARHNGTVIKSYKNILPAFSVSIADSDADALADEPGVVSVEQVARMFPSQSLSTSCAVDSNIYWYLDRVDRQTYALDGQYRYSQLGTGVIAYVVDSGIMQAHQEFAPGTRVLRGQSFGDARQCGIDYGTAPCEGAIKSDDLGSHGTGVASVLGGTMSGIAKNVYLVPLVWLPCNYLIVV